MYHNVHPKVCEWLEIVNIRTFQTAIMRENMTLDAESRRLRAKQVGRMKHF